jgi:hypothetical protein
MEFDENSTETTGYYLERAGECERLADAAMTEENREILLRLAARWRAFAAERRGRPDTRVNLERYTAMADETPEILRAQIDHQRRLAQLVTDAGVRAEIEKDD